MPPFPKSMTASAASPLPFWCAGHLSPHWRTVPEALAAFQPLGLLPFYYHYMVPKAHAAANVAWQVLTFAPIGVMIALDPSKDRLWLGQKMVVRLVNAP